MVKKKQSLILFLSIFICFKNNFLLAECRSAITYVLNQGRFGDNLLNYIKAKYLAYKHELDFYYMPFKYSSDLMISKLEKKYNKAIEKKFKRVFRLEKNSFVLNKNSSNLYISDYYTKVDIDSFDESFIKELKKYIAPCIKIPKHIIPSNRVSVAVHVRKGGGFDLPLFTDSKVNNAVKQACSYADYHWPLKFPPDEYYIEQIRYLYNILDKKALYIYIFTDHKEPQSIVDKYSNVLNDLDIMFFCRQESNFHDKNVIEDFFSMMQYDCLIRSASNFSVCADIIGDFFISIYPMHAYWKNGKLIVDKVGIKKSLIKLKEG